MFKKILTTFLEGLEVEMILSAYAISRQLLMLARQYRKTAQILWEGNSHEGRPIYSVRVGAGKKTLICTGGVHGRESVNPTVLVKMTKEYCAKYPKELEETSILFLPLLNPDGYEIALHRDKEWKYNARGVDINRNFPCRSYRKQKPEDMPLSEVESRILADIFQREDSIGYIDFHSRGREIYWYRAAMDTAYNKRAKKIARALCECNGYRLGTAADELLECTSGGNTVQYYSENYQLPAITVETIAEEAEFPLHEKWVDITLKEICMLPLHYLRCQELI